jgi:hypothetical protein
MTYGICYGHEQRDDVGDETQHRGRGSARHDVIVFYRTLLVTENGVHLPAQQPERMMEEIIHIKPALASTPDNTKLCEETRVPAYPLRIWRCGSHLSFLGVL